MLQELLVECRRLLRIAARLLEVESNETVIMALLAANDELSSGINGRNSNALDSRGTTKMHGHC